MFTFAKTINNAPNVCNNKLLNYNRFIHRYIWKLLYMFCKITGLLIDVSLLCVGSRLTLTLRLIICKPLFLGSLLEVAQYLSATASMLDSAQLDHIEGRLTALSQKMDSLSEKEQQVSYSSEDQQKVRSRTFSQVINWKFWRSCGHIPDIISFHVFSDVFWCLISLHLTCLLIFAMG